jgi:hypothetical protein
MHYGMRGNGVYIIIFSLTVKNQSNSSWRIRTGCHLSDSKQLAGSFSIGKPSLHVTDLAFVTLVC